MTTITSVLGHTSLAIDALSEKEFSVTLDYVGYPGDAHGGSFYRDALLAAVAEACNAIIVPTETIGHEWGDDGSLMVGGRSRTCDWWLDEENVEFARAILAGNEIAKNPPARTKAVTKISQALAEEGLLSKPSSEIAQRLYDLGLRFGEE